MKKTMKIVSSLTTTLLFLLLIVMSIAVITSKASGGEPEIMGYQLKPVLSGSMEPTFMTGSIIAIEQVEDTNSLEVDDVITYMESDNKIVTHRITEVITSGENILYRTKGDNNEEVDLEPILSSNVIGKYTGFTIPYAGYFAEFSKSKNGTLLLIIPGVLLLIYAVSSILSALREIEKPKKADDIQKTV